MSLYIVEGKPGSGKSYHVVTMILQVLQDWIEYSRRENKPLERLLYTNLKLDFSCVNEYLIKRVGGEVDVSPYIREIDDDVKKTFLHAGGHCPLALLPQNALIVIDEVQNLFGAEIGSGKSRDPFFVSFRNYISEHRHYGHELIFITQDIGNIASPILAMAEKLLHVNNVKNMVLPFPLNIPFSDLDVVKEAWGFETQFYRVCVGKLFGRRVRFDGLPLSDAMNLITDETGITIVWSSSLDASLVYGSFFHESVPVILESVARRIGCQVSEVDGVYFLGEINRNSLVSAVVYMIPVEHGELIDAIQKGMSQEGQVAVIGGSLYLRDTFSFIRNVLSDLERIRRNSEHSYLAEVFFIRIKEDDFINITGDLQIRQVDVFSSSLNLDALFQMFVDADAGKSFASVEQRPVLYLSEGREAVFNVGSEIVREKKGVNLILRMLW
jgi:hypothetical protein